MPNPEPTPEPRAGQARPQPGTAAPALAAAPARGWPAIGLAVTVSVLVHLVPVLWWAWPGRSAPSVPVQAEAPPIVVELAPVLQSARVQPSDLRLAPDRRQVDATRPRPQPLPPPEPRIARTEAVPEPVLALREKAERAPEPKPASPPREEQSAAAAPQLAVHSPSLQTTAPVAGASSRATDARQTWESQVVAALERVKRYPAAARWSRAEDTVLVRFAVSRSGAVSGVRILKSQRFAPLDNEALAMPERAAPLPIPPQAMSEDPVVVTVPIDFYLSGN